MILPVGGLIKKLIKKKKKIKVGSEEWNKKWREMSNNQRISSITSDSEVRNWYDSRKKVRRTPKTKGKKNPVGSRPGKVKPKKITLKGTVKPTKAGFKERKKRMGTPKPTKLY